MEEEWGEVVEAYFVEKHSEEEDSYEKVVREVQVTFHQNLLNEGNSEGDIEKMIEEGYIESRSVLKYRSEIFKKLE